MEVRQVRIDEVKLIKIDEPSANIRYIGRSDSMRASESDACWQILRQYRHGDIITSTYALMGEFKGKWSDRATYFDPAIPDDSNPLDGNISVTGSFTPGGLKFGGRVSQITLSASSWTALPPSGPLSNRNAINVQNYSGDEIKLNFDPLVGGYIGIYLNDQSERNYDIKDTIQIYAKAKTDGQVITIEEIS